MQKIEVTVIFAFDNVPDDVDLENLTIEGIGNAVLMDSSGNVLVAKPIGYETVDAIGQADFVMGIEAE